MSDAYDNGHRAGLIQGRADGRDTGEIIDPQQDPERYELRKGWAAGYAEGYTEETGQVPPGIPLAEGATCGGLKPGEHVPPG